MKPLFFRAALCGVLVLAAVPAGAAKLFTIAALGGTPSSYSFSFQIADGALPSFVTATSARFNGTPFSYTRPNGTGPFVESGMFDGPTFFTTLDQSGVALLRLDREPIQFQQFRLFGTQLFTGPTSAPMFRLGSFDLSSTPRNGGDPIQPLTFRVTVSDIGVVPEPATWAMMIAGFATIGVALRRRRRATPMATSQ